MLLLLVPTSFAVADLTQLEEQAGSTVLGSQPARVLTSYDLVTARIVGGDDGFGLSISPDGKYMAFELHSADLARNTYDVHWVVASTEGPEVANSVGDAGQPELFKSRDAGGAVNGSWSSQKPLWSADSQYIVYTKKTDAGVQLWRSRRDGSIQQQLTFNDADVQGYRWTQDDRKLFFTTDAPRKELRESEEARLAKGALFRYDAQWSVFEGKTYAEPYALTGGRPMLWVYDLRGMEERRATAEEAEEFVQLTAAPAYEHALPDARTVSLAPSGRLLAWLEPSEASKTGRYPPLTLYAGVSGEHKAERCMAPECTGQLSIEPFASGLEWGPDEEEIYFFRREGTGYAINTLYGWNVRADRIRRIYSTDTWISDCSRVGDKLICFKQSPDYPRIIMSIGLSRGSPTTLYDPNPVFGNRTTSTVERFEWADKQGHETFGFLVKPVDHEPGQRYPLIIVGYQARHTFFGGVGHEFPVHPAAANGFAILVYERPVDWATYAVESDRYELYLNDWGPNMFDYRVPLSLFESAISKLSNRGLIDPEKVGIAGFSNGSGHVAYSLVNSDLFSAATTAWSIHSPCTYFLSGAPGEFRRKLQHRAGVGPFGSKYDWKWNQISLALNAEEIDAPLLIQSSDYEHVRALQDVIALIEAGKPVEMHVFPDEFHVKWQPAHRLAVYQRNLDWFNFWLKSVEDPNPYKAAQYRRWRRLGEQHSREVNRHVEEDVKSP